jgi:Holliday junction resolvase RusA-like endonuclease
VTADPVTVTLLGEPVAWARTRPGKQANGSGGFAITPKKQRNNTAALQIAAMGEMVGREPFDCPLRMDIEAQFAIPASWSPRKRERALRGELRPAKKPDLSNIAKQIEDAFNKIVYRDDALIVEYGKARKVYGVQPKIVVTVRPIDAAPSRIPGLASLPNSELDDMIDAEAARPGPLARVIP